MLNVLGFPGWNMRCIQLTPFNNDSMRGIFHAFRE